MGSLVDNGSGLADFGLGRLSQVGVWVNFGSTFSWFNKFVSTTRKLFIRKIFVQVSSGQVHLTSGSKQVGFFTS